MQYVKLPLKPTRDILAKIMRNRGDDPDAMSGDTDMLTMYYDEEEKAYMDVVNAIRFDGDEEVIYESINDPNLEGMIAILTNCGLLNVQ